MKRASLRDVGVEIFRGGRQPLNLLGSAQKRTCEGCGVEMASRRKDARYCTGACRAEAARQRRRAA